MGGIHGQGQVLDGHDVFVIIQFLDGLGGKGGRAQEGDGGEKDVRFHFVLFSVKIGFFGESAYYK